MPLSGNVSNLTADVAKLLRDQGITATDEEDYIDALNNAQDKLSEILRLFHERTTFSTTSGTQNYDLPSDFMAVYEDNSIVYTDEDGDDHRVRYTTYDVVREYDDLTTAVGDPDVFWIHNDDIFFYPTPDYTGTSNAELEHYRYVASLGGGVTIISDITTITDDYTVLTTDTTIFANGTLTVTLLDAVANGSMEITLKNTGTGIVTVAAASGQTIDGDSNYYLYTQYGACTLKSNGVNWFIIEKV